MNDQAMESPLHVLDEHIFEYVEALSAESERMLRGKNAELLRYLLAMVSLEAKRRGVAAAMLSKDRAQGDEAYI